MPDATLRGMPPSQMGRYIGKVLGYTLKCQLFCRNKAHIHVSTVDDHFPIAVIIFGYLYYRSRLLISTTMAEASDVFKHWDTNSDDSLLDRQQGDSDASNIKYVVVTFGRSFPSL